MIHGATEGWLTVHGVRGRLSFFGSSILVLLLYSTLFYLYFVATFLLLVGTYTISLALILIIALLYIFTIICLLAQRLRDCGVTGTSLILLMVLCFIFPIAQIIFIFWPGVDHDTETEFRPIQDWEKKYL